jgi:hypothetical protein
MLCVVDLLWFLDSVAISCIRNKANVVAMDQQYQSYLDKSVPHISYRWIGTGILLLVFLLRIVVKQGWYIGSVSTSLLSEALDS